MYKYVDFNWSVATTTDELCRILSTCQRPQQKHQHTYRTGSLDLRISPSMFNTLRGTNCTVYYIDNKPLDRNTIRQKNIYHKKHIPLGKPPHKTYRGHGFSKAASSLFQNPRQHLLRAPVRFRKRTRRLCNSVRQQHHFGRW